PPVGDRTPPTPRRSPNRGRPPAGRRRGRPPRRLPVLLIVLGFVVAALVATVIASRSSHKTTNTPAPAGSHQTQPVSVTGTALSRLPGPGTPDPAVGRAMPTLKGESFDGTAVTIDPSDRHPKGIAFGAHWWP